MVRRSSPLAWLCAALVVAAAPAVAVADGAGDPGGAPVDDEEDDPGFERKIAAPEAVFGEEPMPGEPVAAGPAPAGVDPAGAAAPAAASPAAGEATSVRARAGRGKPPLGVSLQGIGTRLSYRSLSLVEPAGRPDAEFDQPFAAQRFHGLALDVYPVSWYTRLGLSTQVAYESEGKDWVGTEGVTGGIQWPGHALVPFAEVGGHVGMARRTFWMVLEEEPSNYVTLFWAFSAELGVDARVYRSVAVSAAVGLQRSSYFYSAGDLVENALLIKDDTAWTFKLGVGY